MAEAAAAGADGEAAGADGVAAADRADGEAAGVVGASDEVDGSERGWVLVLRRELSASQPPARKITSPMANAGPEVRSSNRLSAPAPPGFESAGVTTAVGTATGGASEFGTVAAGRAVAPAAGISAGSGCPEGAGLGATPGSGEGVEAAGAEPGEGDEAGGIDALAAEDAVLSPGLGSGAPFSALDGACAWGDADPTDVAPGPGLATAAVAAAPVAAVAVAAVAVAVVAVAAVALAAVALAAVGVAVGAAAAG